MYSATEQKCHKHSNTSSLTEWITVLLLDWVAECELIVKRQQWEGESPGVQTMCRSVCVPVCMCLRLIVVQLRGTAERAHIWPRRTSMVTGNLTTQPVLWWQVYVCVAESECGTRRRKCEKESALKKDRWAEKWLFATQLVHRLPLRIAQVL